VVVQGRGERGEWEEMCATEERARAKQQIQEKEEKEKKEKKEKKENDELKTKNKTMKMILGINILIY